MSGLISNAATRLKASLASAVDGLKGAGQVGFGYAMGYAAGTVGKWLQDLALGAGSTFIGFINAGAGAVVRTLQSKARERIDAKDYGVVADGVTDDTANLVKADAAAAAAKKTLYVSGTPLISATFVPTCSEVEFDGNSGGDSQASYLIKKATMATPAVRVTRKDFSWRKGGVLIQSGATGGGFVFEGNNNKAYKPFVIAPAGPSVPSGDGFRFGKDAGPSNVNSWGLYEAYVYGVSGRAGYWHDKPFGTPPDVNAGTAVDCIAQNCGNGWVEGNGRWNQFINMLGESCLNWGMSIGGQDTVVIGGDRESNSIGNLQIALGADRTTLVGVNPSEVGDFSKADPKQINTSRLERAAQAQGQWTPTIVGSGTPGAHVYAVQAGWWFREGDYYMFEGAVTLSALDAAMTGDVQIGGLPFQIPAGLTSSVFAAALSRWGDINLDAGYTQLTLSIGTATSRLDVMECGSAKTAFQLKKANLTNTTQIWFSGRIPLGKF